MNKNYSPKLFSRYATDFSSRYPEKVNNSGIMKKKKTDGTGQTYELYWIEVSEKDKTEYMNEMAKNKRTRNEREKDEQKKRIKIEEEKKIKIEEEKEKKIKEELEEIREKKRNSTEKKVYLKPIFRRKNLILN